MDAIIQALARELGRSEAHIKMWSTLSTREPPSPLSPGIEKSSTAPWTTSCSAN